MTTWASFFPTMEHKVFIGKSSHGGLMMNLHRHDITVIAELDKGKNVH